MQKILVSSAEPSLVFETINSHGLSSSIPEKFGADFLAYEPNGILAIQRKLFPEDYFASIKDGRLQKEIARFEGSLRGIEKKLRDEKFVKNAPAEVVEKEKKKKEDWQNNLNKVKSLLEDIS